MESFLSRYKNAFVLMTLLLVQTIGLATQLNRPADPLHPDGPEVRLLRIWVQATVTPIERLATGTGHGVRNAWANYVNLRHVRQQNADLQQQLASLRLERTAMQEDALEGKRLRSVLNFKREYAGTTVVAQVIGTSGTDASRILTLDKGAKDGLKPDMAVITPDGIVGKLREVFPATSQLLLISDPTSGAGVILASTRIHAVVKGSSPGRVQISSLTPDERIKPGEMVMTSGGDQVFPRGLPVGTVESVALDPERPPYTAITIRPAVNLAQLEEVMIITSFGTPAETESARGPSAGLDTVVHAADISAERLPSLHGGKEQVKDETAKPPAAPARLVPRAALHPDRYSPGAVPAATELTPGQPNPMAMTPAPEQKKIRAGLPAADPPQQLER